MKYIDAEKLIAVLERQNTDKKILQPLIHIIESLQQEQPDFPTTDEQMKEFLATHPKIEVPEKYKNPDWLLKKQEQQEVDLDADIKMEWDSFNKHIAKNSEGVEVVVWLNWFSFVDIANYFYELGKNSK